MATLGWAADKLWTPRLKPYDEDKAVFSQDPFATVFAQHSQHTRTRQQSRDHLWPPLEQKLTEPRWRQHVSDWIVFTLGGQLLTKEAWLDGQRLFLRVLWTRFCHEGSQEGEKLAYDLLVNAQIQMYHNGTFWPYTNIPADHCWFDDLEQRETCDDESPSHDSDSDSDWEDCSDFDIENTADSDYTPDSDDDMDDTDHSLPNFVQEPERDCVWALPKRVPPRPGIATADLPLHYVSNMLRFFYPEQLPAADDEMCVDTLDKSRSALDVVHDLVEMRKLKRKQYDSLGFRSGLQNTGLFDTMHEICRSGNLLETSHPDVETSFRWHNWKISYAELICRWVPPSLSQEEYDQTLPVVDPRYSFTLNEAEELLVFMSLNPRMLPWGFDPMAAFLFFTEQCFASNCDRWLLPCLRTLDYPRVEGWNSAIVHRRLMALPAFTAPHLNQDFLNRLDPRLACIIVETSKRRRLVRQVERQLMRSLNPQPDHDTTDIDSEASDHTASEASDFSDTESVAERPSASSLPTPTLSKSTRRHLSQKASKLRYKEGKGQQVKHAVLGKQSTQFQAARARVERHHHCPHCEGLPMEEQCIRIIYVQFRDPTSLIGAALTCHSPEERLRPKPPPQHRKGSKSKPRTSKSIRYYHPFTELGFGLIRHRRRVYQRCGKDITRLVWRREGHPDEFVGGVRFKVFSKKVLSRLRDNHRRVKICAIRRSDDMEAWSFGDMTGKGSRQASGGYDGDIYGPFASESGSTPDDIRALMCLATGADVLAEAGTSIFPPLKRNLKALTESAGLNHLGRYGISSFYCHNYISCVHEDPDNSAEDVEAGRGRTTGRGGQFPCVQLTKSGCSKNSYNFAYTAFGQVIQTRSNTVWLFNGRHAHATTVMPSQREVNRRARSEGWHDTAPGAAVVRARRLRMIRCGYNLRPRVV